jgi:8-amino-7-oxononanoate synthase
MSFGSQCHEDAQTAVAQVAVAQMVFDQVRSRLPGGVESELSLNSSLAELGLDSLARMSVVNHLEEVYRIRVPEELLYDMETCGDLVECIETLIPQGSPRRAARPLIPTRLAPTVTAAPVPRTLRAEDYDVAQFPECVAFHKRVMDTTAAGFELPFVRTKEGISGAVVRVAGQDLISYTSFDYLGLAGSPVVMKAAQQAIEQFGTSASASRLVGGDNTIISTLDEELARFLGAESAIVFPCGYGTNASVFGHLFGAEDLILYDELAHNSIVQGAVASKAQRRPFPHNDYAFLDRVLSDVRSHYRRVVVATEGVYSMDGDFPDLPKFVEVKNRHHALLYVDEAHSVGVLGRTGRGICEHFGLEATDGDLWMGTISKALGSSGGYLAGRKSLIHYLKYTTPSLVFSTGSSPATSAAALAALRTLQQEPQRVQVLRDRSALFLRLAKENGLNTGTSRETPVIPVILGDSLRSIWVSQELMRCGIDAQPILYPAVQESAARIRFFLTADHTEDQIRYTVQTVADCVAASADLRTMAKV